MVSFGLGQATPSDDPIEPSTPWMAASDGKLALLQMAMTKYNLQANAADENGYTLLHAASAYNQRPVMEFLVQNNADPNAQDNDGDTPLHHVEQIGAAQFLIETAGANPAIANAEGKTPLQSRQEDLQEQIDDADEDEDDDLKALVAYLGSK